MASSARKTEAVRDVLGQRSGKFLLETLGLGEGKDKEAVGVFSKCMQITL